jgi:hypothetical protein
MSEVRRLIKADEMPDGGTLRLEEVKYYTRVYRGGTPHERLDKKRSGFYFHRYNVDGSFRFWCPPGQVLTLAEALTLWNQVYSQEYNRYTNKEAAQTPVSLR